MSRASSSGQTEPFTWSRVKIGASGNSRASESRTFSPPRMPVSQSWTSATRGGAGRADGIAAGTTDAEWALADVLRGGAGRDGVAEDLHVAGVDGLHRALPAELLHARAPARRQLVAQPFVSEHALEAVRDVLGAVGVDEQRRVAHHL